MDKDLDPLTTIEVEAAISHRGILLAMAALVIVLTVAGTVIGGLSFGVGVVIGGILSFINYFWLDRSTKAIFAETAVASTGLLAAKYILRYVAIGAVLLLIYMTNAVPVAAVIMGLAAFAFAVVLQGLKNIFSSTL